MTELLLFGEVVL